MATIPSTKELRSMNAADLRTEIAEQERVLAKLKLDVANQGEKDTAKVRTLRRDIARVHTVLGEKTTSATVPAPHAPKAAARTAPSPKNK